ncbi:MAG TPA: hypothetical protein VGF16_08340 [Bryobacteraceae bacterium]|jgi:hypothetical protein
MEWLSVWAALSDDALEKRLRYYLWLAISVPNTHERRVAQLIEEAERRGNHEMVARAKTWVASSATAPPPLA